MIAPTSGRRGIKAREILRGTAFGRSTGRVPNDIAGMSAARSFVQDESMGAGDTEARRTKGWKEGGGGGGGGGWVDNYLPYNVEEKRC